VQRQRQLPSIVWIFIFAGGIVVLIGGIVGLFYLLSHVEGFGSVLMVVIAWGIIRLGSQTPTPNKASYPVGGWVTALGIIFFALMGVAIDQTGNFLYNKPIEWLFCPSQTELRRDVAITNPMPGQTNIAQEFSCVESKENQVVKGVDAFKVLAVRFVEYVLIGYVLLGLNRVYIMFRARLTSPDS
jgi:hypothetical protein